MPTSFQLFYFNYLVQSIVSFSLYAQPRQYFSSKSPFTVSLCHKKYNSFVLCENAMLAKLAILNLDESNTCITYLLRPRETVCFVALTPPLWRGHKTCCFPEVSVNKCSHTPLRDAAHSSLTFNKKYLILTNKDRNKYQPGSSC